MPSEEFFKELTQETEVKVKAYQDFAKQLQETIDAMKFLAKQINANNQMLQLQGLDIVKFEK